jgi:glycosyltransferase involved in cell wall biosynthesis
MDTKSDRVHGLRIPKDSARELIYLWAKNGLAEIIHTPNTEFIWTGTGLGDILLYDWDKPDTWENAHTTRGITANIILWGNPTSPNSRGNSPWILWGRHPELIAKYDHDLLEWEQKDITSAFVGRIENGVQHRNRTQHDWSSCIELFDMPIGADAKYRYGPEEYLTVMRRVKYGLSLPGYGNKCNRDIELFATGVVPIFTPGCATDYDDPLIIGKHILFAENPTEVTRIIRETTPEKWRELRAAGHDWYLRNCSMRGSFETTQRIINRETTKLISELDKYTSAIRRIPPKKTPDIKRICIDLVFFQRSFSGISRVWETLLTHIPRVLDRTGKRSNYEIILIRRETCNIDPSIISQYRQILLPDFTYSQPLEQQSTFLTQLCNQISADIFISTYYTHLSSSTSRSTSTSTSTKISTDSEKLNTKSVIIIHDMIPENLGYPMNPMWQQKHRAIRNANQIICISQSTAADLRRTFSDVPAARESTVIYNSFDRNIWKIPPITSDMITHRKSQQPWKILIMTSNTDPYKGLTIITEMLRKFAPRFGAKQWQFHFLCSRSQIISPHDRETIPSTLNIVFHGDNHHKKQLTNTQIAEIYTNSSAIVYPTAAEGFGLPILEAAHLQIPIITRPLPVFVELFGDFNYYVNDTAESFFRKLMELSRTQFNLDVEKNKLARDILMKYNPLTQTETFISTVF